MSSWSLVNCQGASVVNTKIVSVSAYLGGSTWTGHVTIRGRNESCSVIKIVVTETLNSEFHSSNCLNMSVKPFSGVSWEPDDFRHVNRSKLLELLQGSMRAGKL